MPVRHAVLAVRVARVLAPARAQLLERALLPEREEDVLDFCDALPHHVALVEGGLEVLVVAAQHEHRQLAQAQRHVLAERQEALAQRGVADVRDVLEHLGRRIGAAAAALEAVAKQRDEKPATTASTTPASF